MNLPKMSKQMCSTINEQPDANSICTTNNKRKKLSLSSEFLRDMAHFKRMFVIQKQNYEIGFLDPINGEQLKLMCTDTVCTGRVLQSGVRTLQAAIVRERSHRREYVDGLTRYMHELSQLDEAKEKMLDGLERMQAGVDGVVDALRADVERAHGEYEERKRRFIRFCDGVMDEHESTAVLRLRALTVSSSTGHGGAAGWLDDAEDAEDDTDQDAEDDTDQDADVTAVKTVFRRLLQRDAETRGPNGCRSRTKELTTLWHAVRSVAENNRMLEKAARALEDQTETLQASLRGATAVCTALDVNKSAKKCRAVVLDDFCAVTEQITAQQIRNLEFSRMLAVDEQQIGEELHKIGQLQAKVSRKKEKRQRLLEQTDSMKSQLEIYKNHYEDLQRKRTDLEDYLQGLKCSPSKSTNQSEQRSFEQRVKHLEQLKNQHNLLTNQREALKLKIQLQAVKTPRRINELCNT